MQELVILLFILIIIFAIFVIAKNAFHVVESKKLFYPVRDYQMYPKQLYSEIILSTGAVAWYFNNYPNAPTILYCHGNAANISYWNNMIDLIDSQHLNLFIFDYHGFGKSPGVATINTLFVDSDAAYKWLAQRVPGDQIVVWGESMGGAPAIEIARKHKIAYLCLAGTFSHPADVLAEWGYPKHMRLAAKLLKKLDNRKHLSKVQIPVVIIHSPDDDIIPYVCAIDLYYSVPHQCKKLITIGGTHVTPKITIEQMQEIFNFCNFDTQYCKDGSSHLKAICEDCRRFCPFGKICT